MATIKTLLGNVKGKDGRGYEEVVLYSGTCSACISSNVATSTSPMIEMSESIENYSSIRIEFQYLDSTSSGEGASSTSTTFSTEYIKKVYTHSSLTSTASYGNVSAAQIFGFYDATHLVLMWELYTGITHNVSYITVTGIKNATSDAEKNFNKYSTTEEVVGTWYDGKNIYRKVMKFPVIKPDMTVLTNVDHIINVGGYFIWNGNMSHQYKFPCNDNDVMAHIVVDNNIAKIRTNYTNDTLINLVLYLEYTKTT